MPYINEDTRKQLDSDIRCLIYQIDHQEASRAGILNYVISRIVTETIHGSGYRNWSYFDITQVVTTFECAKLEFYRRVAGPKEDEAIIKNGDLPAYEQARQRNTLGENYDAFIKRSGDGTIDPQTPETD